MFVRSPRIRLILVLLSLVCAFSAALEAEAGDESKLLLATTTSVQDTGLLDALLPLFRERTGIAVQVVAVGSGAALFTPLLAEKHVRGDTAGPAAK